MYEPIDLGEPPAARCFEDRLKTFTNWPNPHLSPTILAKAGFQYTRVADIVRCVFCGVEGYQWCQGDDPLADHIKWKPDCPFVTKRIPVKRCKTPEDEPPSTVGRLCKICFANEMTVVVNPCHHLFACVKCTLTLSRCAICRGNIDSAFKVFIA